MKRSLPWLALFALLAPLAGAADQAQVSGERARQFQRNRDLIQTLVHGSLRLATEDDPLKRAEQCNGLAEQLAAAIRQAAECRDTTRVVELGQHLHALLEQGIAANLRTARKQIPPGSTLEKQLERVRKQAADLVQPLEEQLEEGVGAANQEDMEQTRKALREGRHEVNNAIIIAGDGK
jgi:hypothetical protein